MHRRSLAPCPADPPVRRYSLRRILPPVASWGSGPRRPAVRKPTCARSQAAIVSGDHSTVGSKRIAAEAGSSSSETRPLGSPSADLSRSPSEVYCSSAADTWSFGDFVACKVYLYSNAKIRPASGYGRRFVRTGTSTARVFDPSSPRIRILSVRSTIIVYPTCESAVSQTPSS